MAKPRYVLGTGLSHDGSACLLKDGRIHVAIEKERITRVKHDGHNDAAAVAYVLDAADITLNDVELVVQNANFGMFAYGNEWYAGARPFTAETPMATISHHTAHAYSAFGPSPFEEAAVLVIDGCGSGYDDCMDLGGAEIGERPTEGVEHLWFEKDSYYSGFGGKIRSVYKDFSPFGFMGRRYPMHPPTTQHSIGGVYAAVSTYIFGGIDDSGKLMGLAPYGRPGMFDFEIFDLRDGRVFVRYDWMRQFRNPARNNEERRAAFQHHADLAWHVQAEVERAILYVAEARYRASPSENLCYAGGVALNAVANRRLLLESPFKNLFIQPAAGDNGLAVGCAFYGWLELLSGERLETGPNVRYGRGYRSNEVEEAIAAQGEQLASRVSTNVAADAAQLLADGKVIGWCQGPAELGPRALGGRSILADPRRPDVRNHINRNIKFREDFRPFAPSVREEDVAEYYQEVFHSPHMLLVSVMRPEFRGNLASIVHLNDTSRIQTVTSEADPLYHCLISEFRKITGLGMVLNTSLNRRGMPIVETPKDAINFFLECGLDALVIEDRIVTKVEVAHEHEDGLFCEHLEA